MHRLAVLVARPLTLEHSPLGCTIRGSGDARNGHCFRRFLGDYWWFPGGFCGLSGWFSGGFGVLLGGLDFLGENILKLVCSGVFWVVSGWFRGGSGRVFRNGFSRVSGVLRNDLRRGGFLLFQPPEPASISDCVLLLCADSACR